MGGTLSLEVQDCPSPVVEEVYRTRRIPSADGTTRPMNVYIPRDEGNLLYTLVRELQPAVTVEVGMANGLSTLFIAEALAANGLGRHVAIDPYQKTDWHSAGLALLRRARLDHLVELIELPSHQALPELERAGVKAGLIFIDGNHLFDYVMTDFLCADRLLVDGGIVVFDDSDWPAVTQVIRFALGNRHYEVACPEVVVEPVRYSPRLPARLLRRLCRSVPKLAAQVRPDFLRPSHELGVRGRCVALRKLRSDDRDSQSRFHCAF
ncbi:MAG: class I SAM-dependent methyltransferase [Gemmataceae bacterium]